MAVFIDLSPLPGLLVRQYPTGGLRPRLLALAPPGHADLAFRDRNQLLNSDNQFCGAGIAIGIAGTQTDQMFAGGEVRGGQREILRG